jgi:PAS domain S-box-containing protein
VSATPTEQRLKLIIESAPVSLIIIDSQGRTLAGNRASLALFGAARLEDVVAQNFAARVCPKDREAFVAFVTRVCQGQSESLQYEVLGFDDARRRVETQAVPLRRDGGVAAFLGASWQAAEHGDPSSAIGEMQSKYEQLRAERDALNDKLASTEAMYEERLRDREAERGLLEERFRDTEERLQTALAEARHGHEEIARQWSTERETLTSQWTAERESLIAKVRVAEEHDAAVTAQLAAEQLARQNAMDQARNEYEASLAAAMAETEEQRTVFEGLRREHEAVLAAHVAENLERQSVLEAARRESEAALAARIEENRELESTLSRLHERYEAAIAESRATCHDLRGTIHELEQRGEELLGERNAERATMENAVKAERARYEALLEERGKWLAELAEVVEPLRDSSARVGRLLSTAPFAQPATHSTGGDDREQPTEPSEEATWQF